MSMPAICHGVPPTTTKEILYYSYFKSNFHVLLEGRTLVNILQGFAPPSVKNQSVCKKFPLKF